MNTRHKEVNSSASISNEGNRNEVINEEENQESESETELLDDDDAEINDGEVEVLKANIFHYQYEGELAHDEELRQGILYYKYEDFDDEEIEILDDSDNDSERNVSHVDEDVEISCEECGIMVNLTELEEHKNSFHPPPPNRKMLQFTDGNFFMMVDD